MLLGNLNNVVLSNTNMPKNLGNAPKPKASNTGKKPVKKAEDPKNKEDLEYLIIKNKMEEEALNSEKKRKDLEQQLEEKKYKNIMVRVSDQENILCLSIDGSDHSKRAFDIVVDEFMNRIHDSVLLCPHIYNNLHDSEYNWRYQKEFVIDYFKNKLVTSLADYQGYLVIQDRDTYKVHEVQQCYTIAEMNKCKYFFCGLEGLREQNLKKSKIDIALDYLLAESRIPCMIIKDEYKRGTKNPGYKWLVLMNRTSSDCNMILDLYLPLMDRDKDRIYGLTILPHYVSFDDIKKPFYQKMEELNFIEGEQFEYRCETGINNTYEFIKDFVNNNEQHFFDFIIFLNRPEKYMAQRQNSEAFKYVKSLNANVGFCNYAFLYGYDYKEISKLPDEKDPRLYLAKATELPSQVLRNTSPKEEETAKASSNETGETELHSEIYGSRPIMNPVPKEEEKKIVEEKPVEEPKVEEETKNVVVQKEGPKAPETNNQKSKAPPVTKKAAAPTGAKKSLPTTKKPVGSGAKGTTGAAKTGKKK